MEPAQKVKTAGLVVLGACVVLPPLALLAWWATASLTGLIVVATAIWICCAIAFYIILEG